MDTGTPDDGTDGRHVRPSHTTGPAIGGAPHLRRGAALEAKELEVALERIAVTPGRGSDELRQAERPPAPRSGCPPGPEWFPRGADGPGIARRASCIASRMGMITCDAARLLMPCVGCARLSTLARKLRLRGKVPNAASGMLIPKEREPVTSRRGRTELRAGLEITNEGAGLPAGRWAGGPGAGRRRAMGRPGAGAWVEPLRAVRGRGMGLPRIHRTRGEMPAAAIARHLGKDGLRRHLRDQTLRETGRIARLTRESGGLPLRGSIPATRDPWPPKRPPAALFVRRPRRPPISAAVHAGRCPPTALPGAPRPYGPAGLRRGPDEGCRLEPRRIGGQSSPIGPSSPTERPCLGRKTRRDAAFESDPAFGSARAARGAAHGPDIRRDPDPHTGRDADHATRSGAPAGRVSQRPDRGLRLS